jgi:hypothetical protein
MVGVGGSSPLGCTKFFNKNSHLGGFFYVQNPREYYLNLFRYIWLYPAILLGIRQCGKKCGINKKAPFQNSSVAGVWNFN